MKKITIFFLIQFIMFSLSVFSQSSIYKQLQIQEKDIEKLNQRLLELLSKDTVIHNSDDYEFIHVYWLILKDNLSIIKKEDLLSGEYVNKVTTDFVVYKKSLFKKDSILFTTKNIMINKKDGKLIANGNSQIFRRYLKNDQYTIEKDMEFIELTRKKDFELFFLISWITPIFALTKNGELWVIRKNTEKKFEINTLEYFLEHDYDTWGWWNM